MKSTLQFEYDPRGNGGTITRGYARITLRAVSECLTISESGLGEDRLWFATKSERDPKISTFNSVSLTRNDLKLLSRIIAYHKHHKRLPETAEMAWEFRKPKGAIVDSDGGE